MANPTFGDVAMSLFVAGATFGDVGMSLFVAGATFGDVGMSLFMAGTILGDVGASLFVAGAIHAVMLDCHLSWHAQHLAILERCFWWQWPHLLKFRYIAGARNVAFFHAKCVANGGKISSANGRAEFCNFMLGSWSHKPVEPPSHSCTPQRHPPPGATQTRKQSHSHHSPPSRRFSSSVSGMSRGGLV